MKINKKIIQGGVLAAKGFKAGGVHCGIKGALADKNKNDLGMIYCPTGASLAGVFTEAIVHSPTIDWNLSLAYQNHLIKAIVVNSGNANAYTGEDGMAAVGLTAQEMATVFGIEANEVAIGSTGITGVKLPIDIVKAGIAKLPQVLGDTPEYSRKFNNAIMTTDLTEKSYALEVEVDGITFHIGGVSKGSGMIHPNMATMLGFITTDLFLNKTTFQHWLSVANQVSFNAITVDGDTSPNDMCLLLSSNLVEVPEDKLHTVSHAFHEALEEVCKELAKEIARDGEGATKFVELDMINVDTVENAVKIGRTIMSSNLVKTALFGNSANWGRILAAASRAGVEFDPDSVDVGIVKPDNNIIWLAKSSMGIEFNKDEVVELIKKKDVKLIVNINSGETKATIWGCDMSYDYVKINADYN